MKKLLLSTRFSQRFSINNLIHFTLEWLFEINLHKIRVWFELPWNRENMKQSNHRRSIDRFWSFSGKSLSRTNHYFLWHCFYMQRVRRSCRFSHRIVFRRFLLPTGNQLFLSFSENNSLVDWKYESQEWFIRP